MVSRRRHGDETARQDPSKATHGQEAALRNSFPIGPGEQCAPARNHPNEPVPGENRRDEHKTEIIIIAGLTRKK